LASLALGGSRIIAKATNTMPEMLSNLPMDSAAFKDRQLVVVQLNGGNDGLNTVVPLNDYDNYALLRPNIKFAQNQLLTLDSTLPLDHQVGLHPTLTKFKTLYDAGKLNVLQGVGYPSPNYSHFRSTDIIFRGLDGTSGSQNGTDSSGWVAKYLSSVHPTYTGLPTPNLEHPLGINIGTSSTNVTFEHQTNFNMGINIYSTAREKFYGNLGMAQPQATNSEYKSILDYVSTVEEGAQKYNNVIENAFNSGSNLYTSYPNTDLSRQFRVISRLINGGLESKVFTTFKSGFDTHVNQIQSANPLIGKHTDILNDVSESIYAFQKDLEMAGLADKVIIVVVSEFGRKLAENGNNGTDHGNLAPWFVIGNNVKPGVTGRNIDLDPAKVSSSGRSIDERQIDYRQLISTICQDWFGGNNQVLDQMSMSAFSGDLGTVNGKIDIIDNGQAVPENDLIKVLTDPYIQVDEIVLIKEENGWSYYGRLFEVETYLFAIEKKPTTGNSVDFTPTIKINNLFEDGTGKNYFLKEKDDTKHLILGQFWSITNASGLDGFVNLRFFIHSDRINALETMGDDFQQTTDAHNNSGVMWLKTKTAFNDISSKQRTNGFDTGVYPLKNNVDGIFEGQNYIQFNEVEDIDNTSGIASQMVFEKPKPSTSHPNKGEIYFDKTTKRFRGWNGQKWVNLSL